MRSEPTFEIVCRNVVQLANCSQRKLALRAGLPLGVVNKIFQRAQGKPTSSGLTLETIVRLASALDVPPGDLLRAPEAAEPSVLE
jgi:transcriptional regulator with XRE-family HTH domain